MELFLTIVPALIASVLCWLALVKPPKLSQNAYISLFVWLGQAIIYSFIAVSSSIVHGVRLSYFLIGFIFSLIEFHALQTIHWEITDHVASKKSFLSAAKKLLIDLIHLVIVIVCVNFAWSFARGNIFGWL